MKGKASIAAIALMAVAVTGCATKRYGRLQPLTSYETLNYSCDLIHIELAKVDAFDRQVEQQAKFSGMSVASFLGDFGIGNVIERNEAKKTSVERRAQLQGAYAAKRCGDVVVVRTDAPRAVPVPVPENAASQQSAIESSPQATPVNSWWESHRPRGRQESRP